MELPISFVNAFAEGPFSGNSAAVCVLNEWLDDEQMRAIAAQNNLSESAFLVPCQPSEEDEIEIDYEIRWFTPAVEVDLCGHATLASAFVLFDQYLTDRDALTFQSRSGLLRARRGEHGIELDFPSDVPRPYAGEEASQLIAQVAAAVGTAPRTVLQAADLVAVFSDVSAIINMQPDQAKLAELPGRGLVVTASAKADPDKPEHNELVAPLQCDFISRWFGPKVGVPEDPVTGSAHCALTPYWFGRWGQEQMLARQLSSRGGVVHCRHLGRRTRIAGQAHYYLRGTIFC